MPTAHADPLPDDLLTLRAAAALAGRSVDTIRRWRGEHGLRDYRDPSDPSAPSTFSRAELLTLLAKVNATRAPAGADYIDGVLGGADPLQTPVPSRPPTLASQGAMTLQLVEDLRGERVRLLGAWEAERARGEAERARADAATAALDAARRDALELASRLTRLETLLLSGRASALEAERARLAERAGEHPPRHRKGKGKARKG